MNGLGGFGFAAHLTDTGCPPIGDEPFPWRSWDIPLGGLEIWNVLADFYSGTTSIPRGLLHYAFLDYGLKGPDPSLLARWDQLNKVRKVVGVAGGDVHGQRYKVGPLTVPLFTYDDTFRLIHTHILVLEKFTGDLGHDRRLIPQALRQGSSYMSYDRRRSATGFSFVAHDEASMTATMGGSLELQGGVTMATAVGRDLTYEAKDLGAYRVEVYYRLLGRDRPWIFSNPIYVKPVQ
ncbi:MAG TPA: hypothetical protein VGL40_12135 [Bacillota bacterium]